jgi:hypothetical protein
VRHAAGECLAKRKLPTLLGLVRQARDQIHTEVADASRTQPRDVVQRDGARVEAADGRRFLVNERLHAQADAIHAATEEGVEDLAGDGAGGALDSNLCRGLDVKVVSDGLK